jgi:hypothetical protein
MLVLKVITLDNDDKELTSLFSGDSISHSEGPMKGTDTKNYPSAQFIGYANEASEQEFIASYVLIFDNNRVIKDELLVLPKSTCFITESGKTVDTFQSYYKQI